jgi:hypothetical protein
MSTSSLSKQKHHFWPLLWKRYRLTDIHATVSHTPNAFALKRHKPINAHQYNRLEYL